MRKAYSLALATALLFSGCAGSIGDGVNSFLDDIKKRSKEKALNETEDKTLVQTFMDKMPTADIFATQIRVDTKIDLGKGIDDNWLYNPIGYFERNDKETSAYIIWAETAKTRGNHINSYNANVAKELSNYTYLPTIQNYERYYNDLLPIYIEISSDGNMISSFNKILKTENISSAGGIVYEGRTMYKAYQLEVILLKTHLRKFQLNTNKEFFNNNLIQKNI